MKTIMVLIIIFVGEILGIYLVYKGIQKKKNGDVAFEIKHLFKNVSFSESSGTQLIIEGSFIIISGLIFYIAS